MKKSSSGGSKRGTAQLASLIFVVGRRLREEFHTIAKQAPCSFLDLQTLRHIKENRNPSMRDVAAHFMVTPPAATLLVDGLVRHGFIARVADKRDRRTVRLKMTAKGDTLLAKHERRATNLLESLFSELTPAERTQFAALLKKIAK